MIRFAASGLVVGMLGTTWLSWMLSRLTGWSRRGLSLGVLGWLLLLAACFARGAWTGWCGAASLGALLACASVIQEQRWKPDPPAGPGLSGR